MEDQQPLKCTLPLLPYTSINLCGPTNCGKTRFTKRLIEERYNMYETNPPEKILYCYGIFQNLFSEMEKSIKNISFHEGLPTEDYVDKFSNGEHTLIVLDDLMNSVLHSEMAERLFTQGCHHKGYSVVFISQNMYQSGPRARTINLNATYQCLFYNVRDKLQMNCLARQMFPGKTKAFMEAYHDSTTKHKFGYLFIDLSPHSENDYRLRTSIFPGENTIVYIPKE